MATIGLSYELSSDGTYYTCTGIGTATDTSIEIADAIDGIPVTSIGVRAFEGVRLTSVIIPYGIKEIHAYAFSDALDYCTSDIIIPESVETIDDFAFAYCFYESGENGEYNIIIGGGCRKIGDYAFHNSGAKKIKIGLNVIEIGNGAFSACYNIEEIFVPDSVKNLGYDTYDSTEYLDGVFYHCIHLQSVYLGSNITKIFQYAFRDCTFLSFVEIGESVTSIGRYAFYDSGIRQITIPESVVMIGEYAFGSLSGGLRKVRMLSDTPPALDEGAFYCSGDKYGDINFFVPKSAINAYQNEYSSYTNFRYNNLETVATVSYEGKVLATLEWHDEVVLKTRAQIMKENVVVEMNMPCVMTYNGERYVYDTNQDGEYSIGTGDLANGEWWSKTVEFLTGSYLQSNYVNDDITITALGLPTKGIKFAKMSTGDGYGIVSLTDKNVKNVVIPNRYRGEPVVYMQSNFCKNASIKSVFIPGSVATIGGQSFYNCQSLNRVVIEEGYEGVQQTISTYFCMNCINLKEIILPSTLKTIQQYAFFKCSNLHTIYFNGTVEKWKTVIKNAIGFAQNATAKYVICTDGNVYI